MKFISSLSWDLEKNKTSEGGKIANPAWNDVSNLLSEVRTLPGSITLYAGESKEFETRSLQVLSEGNKFILFFSEDDDCGCNVYAYTEIDTCGELVAFCGELYNSTWIFSDFNVVYDSFKLFYDTANVRRELYRNPIA